MGKSNATGRSRHPSHIQIYHSLFDCAAYRALSLDSRALLAELIRLHNGRNNGNIYLSVRDAELLLGMANDATITRAYRELQDHGFIVLVQPGSFHWKTGRASTWRLTFLASDAGGPSREFDRWMASSGSKAARRLERLSASKLRTSFAGLAAHISGTEDANSKIESTRPKWPLSTQNGRWKALKNVLPDAGFERGGV